MNKSVMKCCICNNENIGQFITINNKKYHLCCIEQLQQENQQQNQLLKDKGFIIDKLMEENRQLREKVNKFNIDKINNENKSLKGSCKVLGEKNNNQRKELQRLNNKIEKLKVINEEHKKLNGELREESQKQKEVIDRLNFIKNRKNQGASQENINKMAIEFVNSYLKEVD